MPSSLPWITTREVRLIEPHIGFYLDPTLREVIAHSQALNAHKVGEIQADTRITLPLMYALHSVLRRYERGTQQKLLFMQKWLNRRRQGQGRGDLGHQRAVGRCCQRGMPSIYELPVYLSAIQQLMDGSSHLEVDMHRSAILPDVCEVERGAIHRQVRSLKRQSEHYESYAFSCPSCSADRIVYLTSKTPRVIALRCWYETLTVYWECLTKWLNLLLTTYLTAQQGANLVVHSVHEINLPTHIAAHKALFAMIDTLSRHNLLEFRVNSSRMKLMLFTPPRDWFISIVMSRLPPSGEVTWSWPYTEGLNIITEQVEAGVTDDVVLERQIMRRLPHTNRRITSDAPY